MAFNPTANPVRMSTTGPIQGLGRVVSDTVRQFLVSPHTCVRTTATTNGTLSLLLTPFLIPTRAVPFAGYRVGYSVPISEEVYRFLVGREWEGGSAWITFPLEDLQLPPTRDFFVIRVTRRGEMRDFQTERFLVFLEPNGNPDSWQQNSGGSTSDQDGEEHSSWGRSIEPKRNDPDILCVSSAMWDYLVSSRWGSK